MSYYVDSELLNQVKYLIGCVQTLKERLSQIAGKMKRIESELKAQIHEVEGRVKEVWREITSGHVVPYDLLRSLYYELQRLETMLNQVDYYLSQVEYYLRRGYFSY